MKYNVTPKDCKFVVNEENKTTVCIYDHCENLFLNFIKENCDLHLFDYPPKRESVKYSLYENLKMPNKFTGIATCGKNDEWNVDIGKRIAFSRMKDKLNRSFFKRADLYVKTIDKWMDDAVYLINTVGQKLEVNQEKRHKRIEELVREKNKEDV